MRHRRVRGGGSSSSKSSSSGGGGGSGGGGSGSGSEPCTRASQSKVDKSQRRAGNGDKSAALNAVLVRVLVAAA